MNGTYPYFSKFTLYNTNMKTIPTDSTNLTLYEKLTATLEKLNKCEGAIKATEAVKKFNATCNKLIKNSPSPTPCKDHPKLYLQYT